MVCKFPAWSTTIPSSCPKNLGATLLGSLSDLPDLVRKMRAEVVVVAYSSGDQKSMVGVLRNVMAEGASVWVVPRLFELGRRGSSGDHLWGLPLTYLRSPALFRQWALKRVFDLVLTGVGVLLLSPLMLLISAAVYLDCWATHSPPSEEDHTGGATLRAAEVPHHASRRAQLGNDAMGR